MSTNQTLRISPETTSAEFPGQAYATDAWEATVAGVRQRVVYWSPEAWARTPEACRRDDAVRQRDGAFILIEIV